MIHDPLVSPTAPGVHAFETVASGFDGRSPSDDTCATRNGSARPDGTKWAGLDDATAAEFLRRRLVDLPTPGAPALRLGRHVVLAVDLGDGLHCHEIRFVA